MKMAKRVWWAIKLFVRPDLERRKRVRPARMAHAEEALQTAILDLSEAIRSRK